MPNTMIRRTPKTRVLHIITRLISGGADENTIFSIRGLQKNGYKVDLLVGGESQLKIIQDNDDIHIIILKELTRNINPIKDLIAFFKIFCYIRKNNYAIIHTHTAKAGFLGRLAAKCSGAPIIIHTLHGITFHEFLNPIIKNIYILLEKITGSFTQKLVTVGEDIKQKYCARNIATPEKYITIRSGFDLQNFIHDGNLSPDEQVFEKQRLGLKQTDIVIGSVSRLEPRKGYVYLLEAASIVCEKISDVKFVIAGEGKQRAQLEEEVRKRKLTDKIFFLGYRQSVARIMAIFDIFTLTSLWEGLPRVLVQAAALGKPIVTFDVEGAWEVVEHGINGFIVPSKDTQQLSERLLRMIQHIDQTRAMGQIGKTKINNAWDTQTMIRQIDCVYQELLQR